jgi:D-glycero-D-manno-heptose 1,7-bisphosphate phosphatase
MHAFNAALCRRLAEHDVTIDAVYSCVFHPTEGIGQFRRDSPLRKPRPGMIQQAADEHDLDLAASFAIGDKLTDVLAGRAAGCRTILLSTGRGSQRDNEPEARPDFLVGNLVEAVQAIECAGAPAGRMLQAPGDPREIGQRSRRGHPEYLH